MEWVNLTDNAKEVFLLLNDDIIECPDDIAQGDFDDGAFELQEKGLVQCFQEENGNVILARITGKGKRYLRANPKLKNPVNWTRIAACIAALCSFLALFIACNILTNK